MIVVEGAQTSAGGRDRGDPAGEAEEAPGPPAGKRSAWNGDQLLKQKLGILNDL